MREGEPIASLLPTERVAADADSRLRSVFLQHRLVAGMPRWPGLPPTVAQFVIEQIAEHLLAVPGGLEPLMMLEREQPLLVRSTSIAVLAVSLARAGGWPAGQLAELGASALLHDVGSVLGDGASGRAGFQWLSSRGSSEFWLRCALVARHARAGAGEAGEPPSFSVAVVQLAAVLHERMAATGCVPTAAWLRTEPACAGIPDAVLGLVDRLWPV